MKRWRIIGLILWACCITAAAQAADKVIKGVVLSSEDNEPMIGVSVYLDKEDLAKVGIHTAKGTVTNIDGEFTLSVPEGIERFFCSYIGSKTKETKINGNNNFKILLEPESQMLDAVVVTGYQNIEKRKLTASVSNLKLSDAVVGVSNNIDQALSGQVAGLQAVSTSGTPGAPMKIRIRGTSSLSGSSDPLWVLDGIPLENTNLPKLENLYDVDDMPSSALAGINPSDIESINVLKDAAATAIYGARAANGVIVITTKKGKQGKPLIQFNMRLSYMPRLSMSRLNLMNSDEKVGLELDLLKEDYPQFANKGEVYRIIEGSKLTDLFKEKGYEALPESVKSEIDGLRHFNNDWNKVIFQNALNQSYNLNISGANEKANYYTTLGYSKELGNIKGYSDERINFLSKNSYRLTDRFSFGVSLVASRRKNSSPLSSDGTTNPLYYSRIANPYQKLYDEEGNYVYDYNISNDTDTSMGYNFDNERKNSYNNETANSFSAIIDLKYLITDHLKLTSQLGLQLDKNSREKMAAKETYYMHKKRSNYKFLPEGGMHYMNENSNHQITWKTMAEYKQTFAEKSDFEIMLGSEIRKTNYSYTTTTGYGFDPVTLTTQPVIFPDASKAKSLPLHQTYRQENAYASFFSTLSYSYDGRYTIGGSVRMDGSDLYGVAKKYRFLPLYSVSGLWRISNEKFMKRSEKWLDNLDIRASFGVQGNIDKNTSPLLIGRYNTINMLPGGSEYEINIESAPNDKLRWEKTYSTNIGMDISMFNERISATVDYYYRKGTDLIGLKMLPWETGFTASTINWASMSNKGVEFSLSTTNIKTKNFSWNTTFNFAYNKNKVLKETIREDETHPSREGYSESAIFALRTAGLDENGYPLFLNNKNEKVPLRDLFHLKEGEWGIVSSQLSPKEQRSLYTYIGDAQPPYSGGLFNTFNYKEWEFSISMNYNFGGYVRTQPSYSNLNFDKGHNANRDILNRWTPNNRDSRLPALAINKDYPMDNGWYSNGDAYQKLDIWVKKLNYLRLQSIRAAYNIPNTVTKKWGINSAKVGLEATNLFVISSDYTNYLDPESMGNPYAAPLPKSITFNLNLSF